MVEDIVFWCTVYGDSKKFLKDRIEEKYGEKLTKEQIKRIVGFKFKDWGNLSKNFNRGVCKYHQSVMEQ